MVRGVILGPHLAKARRGKRREESAFAFPKLHEWESPKPCQQRRRPRRHHGLRRASRSNCPVQKRKLSSSHRESHIKPNTSRVLRVSAGLPEYVSTLQRRNSLRHGASRCPRVAFQINLIAPNNLEIPSPSVNRAHRPTPQPARLSECRWRSSSLQTVRTTGSQEHRVLLLH